MAFNVIFFAIMLPRMDFANSVILPIFQNQGDSKTSPNFGNSGNWIISKNFDN